MAFCKISVNNAFGQCILTTDSHFDGGNFYEDCSTCLASSNWEGGGIPCYLEPVNGSIVWGVNFQYVLIFEDKFEGDALDMSKWNTGIQIPINTTTYYDNGTDFEFQHPGVKLFDNYGNKTYTFTTWDNNCNCNVTVVTKYTSSALWSQYAFPLFNNTTYNLEGLNAYSYGICQLSCTLPQVQPYNGGYSFWPPYGNAITFWGSTTGMVWPTFWLYGANNVGSAELDNFEMAFSPFTDPMSIHEDDRVCRYNYSAPNSFCYENHSHDFLTIYSPDEIDYAVDGSIIRGDTKYYGEHDPFIGDNTFFPIYSNPITSDNPDYLYKNCSFPSGIPTYITFGPGLQTTALPQYFQNDNANLNVHSVQFWVPGNCTSSTNVTSTDIHNEATSDIFNAFTGISVTIDGTATAINIPNQRYPWHKSIHGNLEAIAINQVQITGSFQCSGYLVLKADGNMCDEYPGPYPYNDQKNNTRGPVRRKPPTKDSIGITQKTKPNDSLAISINRAAEQKQFTAVVNYVSGVNENQNAEVVVYNMLGQQLFHGNLLIEAGNTLPINLSNQASGMYMVIIQTKNSVLKKKVVLQ